MWVPQALISRTEEVASYQGLHFSTSQSIEQGLREWELQKQGSGNNVDIKEALGTGSLGEGAAEALGEDGTLLCHP